MGYPSNLCMLLDQGRIGAVLLTNSSTEWGNLNLVNFVVMSCLSYPRHMVYLREKTTYPFLSEIHWRLIFSIADYLHI